jgi:hypothetical protein
LAAPLGSNLELIPAKALKADLPPTSFLFFAPKSSVDTDSFYPRPGPTARLRGPVRLSVVGAKGLASPPRDDQPFMHYFPILYGRITCIPRSPGLLMVGTRRTHQICANAPCTARPHPAMDVKTARQPRVNITWYQGSWRPSPAPRFLSGASMLRRTPSFSLQV